MKKHLNLSIEIMVKYVSRKSGLNSVLECILWSKKIVASCNTATNSCARMEIFCAIT